MCDSNHVRVTTKTLEDFGFNMSVSINGEKVGDKTVLNDKHLKMEVFQLMLATHASGDAAFEIGGDKGSSFMGEFCQDVDSMLDSIAIIHDLPFEVQEDDRHGF